MASSVLGKRKRNADRHPYLHGNFARVEKTHPLTPCSYSGKIPPELHGGQYVRNGSNPVSNEDLGRDAHWFDGDGMLSGVAFTRRPSGQIQPEFVNQYILTDVFLSTISTPALRRSPIPSIATLVDPFASVIRICTTVFRAIFIVLLSWLPGSQQTIKKISVANTSILYHDGRALATCESGPPMRVQLPGLETVGWYNGKKAQGEPQEDDGEPELGGGGPLGFMREWITAHPKVDPDTNEMILYNSAFVPPYVHYSIIPADKNPPNSQQIPQRLLNAPVAGIQSPKMMHDFGASRNHTIIMDLPLTLDPINLAKGQPSIMFDSSKPSRFGVFPRREPSNVRWFETDACCIFHTANAWDVHSVQGNVETVDFLVCRMTSATVVFAGGNIAAPQATAPTERRVANARRHASSTNDTAGFEKSPFLESSSSEPTPADEEEEQDRLYYYSFSMTSPKDVSVPTNTITHQFPLTRIPFDFPSVRPDLEMSAAQYIYGCSSTCSSFNSALGRSARIDAIVKVDARELIRRGKENPPPAVAATEDKTACVDNRDLSEIVAEQNKNGTADGDVIQVFQTPPHTYTQEPRFIPRAGASSEDDGYLVAYMFDESQLDEEGEARPDAVSELWVIDARTMRDVLAKVRLPQRVPYGFHGNWFGEQEVRGQRDVVRDDMRRVKPTEEVEARLGTKGRIGRWIVDMVIRAIGG